MITLRARTFRIQTDFSLCQQLSTVIAATADTHEEPCHRNEPDVNPKLIRTTYVTAFYRTINAETFDRDVNQSTYLSNCCVNLLGRDLTLEL